MQKECQRRCADCQGSIPGACAWSETRTLASSKTSRPARELLKRSSRRANECIVLGHAAPAEACAAERQERKKRQSSSGVEKALPQLGTLSQRRL